ncbi:hypothetical protein [Sediminibacter sp. Hel_I_10]|uniref:hypothetical protein n=1 Tax=Sediminibacter sp. Hel_I_10 TaxID=1392490 RepID=UPI00047AB6F0|nr:hypothetical protein [Sediminibacter sp. Hel_I_10]
MDEYKKNIELLNSLGLDFQRKPANKGNYWFYVKTLNGDKLLDGHGSSSVDWLNRNISNVKKLISYKLNPLGKDTDKKFKKYWKEWNEEIEKNRENPFEPFSFQKYLIKELSIKADGKSFGDVTITEECLPYTATFSLSCITPYTEESILDFMKLSGLKIEKTRIILKDYSRIGIRNLKQVNLLLKLGHISYDKK